MLLWLIDVLIGIMVIRWFFRLVEKMTNDSNAIIRFFGYAIMFVAIVHFAGWILGIIF